MARRPAKGMEFGPGFRLVRFLGRGRLGEVWQATDPAGGNVALRIMPLGEGSGPTLGRRLKRVAQLRHPNVVPIHAFWLVGADGNPHWPQPDPVELPRRVKPGILVLIVVMGLADQSLADRLHECRLEGQPGIPAEELLGYLHDAAFALDYLCQPAHYADGGDPIVAHANIKPQNILLAGGVAQVGDFGLAFTAEAQALAPLVGGPILYVPPEIITGNRLTATTDQYPLAVTYYYLRTGTFPFHSGEMTDIIFSRVSGKVDFGQVSPPEQEVLKRATALDPSRRYPTTLGMVRELRWAYETGGPGR